MLKEMSGREQQLMAQMDELIQLKVTRYTQPSGEHALETISSS